MESIAVETQRIPNLPTTSTAQSTLEQQRQHIVCSSTNSRLEGHRSRHHCAISYWSTCPQIIPSAQLLRPLPPSSLSNRHFSIVVAALRRSTASLRIDFE